MAGSLNIPNVFLNASPAPISKLDQDFSVIAAYINVREVARGLLATRPAAGNSGALFVASDVNGGTLYRDNGVSWDQIAGGATATGSSGPGFATVLFF